MKKKITCNKCSATLDLDKAVQVDERHGVVICTECGYSNKLLLTRRNYYSEYKVLNKGGTIVRKRPKMKLTKKERRKMRQQLKDRDVAMKKEAMAAIEKEAK